MILVFLGILEIIVILIVCRLVSTYFLARIRRKLCFLNKDSVILLTGGAMGIGKALAIMFAKFHKCTVIIFDIRDDLKHDILSQIQKEGGKGFYYNVDVSEGEVLESVVKGVLEKFKKVDVLINNAGILNLKYFSDSTFEEFRKVAQVNFLAPIQLISLILPNMITQNRGQIVNISSVASVLAGPKMSEYCATKSALTGFHNALRLELKYQKQNIQTTLVLPYGINTSIFSGIRTKLTKIFPILEAEYVAQEIYDGIIQQKEEIFLPWTLKYVSNVIRMLPCTVMDRMSSYLTYDIFDNFLCRGVRKNS